MTINQIVKNSMLRIRQDGITLTPQNYADIFCQEAKKLKILVDDCNQIDKYIAKLIPALKNETKTYNFRTLHDLMIYFIAKINRINPTEVQNQLQVTLIILKRILQVNAQIKIEGLDQLSITSLHNLTEAITTEDYTLIKDRWNNFLTTFNTDFTAKLSNYGIDTKKDLKTVVDQVIDKLTQPDIANDFNEDVVKILRQALIPSLFNTQPKEFERFCQRVEHDPFLIEDDNIQEEFYHLVQKRVSLDKSKHDKSLQKIEEILSEVSLQLISVIQVTDNSHHNFSTLKDELGKIQNEPEHDPKILKDRLFSIASSLQKETMHINKELNKRKTEMHKMNKHIVELESELKHIKKEMMEDPLTKLLSKRGIIDKLEWLDANFKRDNKANFVLIKIDLDYFSKINENFGHDAGDVILKTFGHILKDGVRDVDFISRFFGESFLIAIVNTSLDKALPFIKNIKDKVSHTKFRYEDKIIQLTASFGLAQRKDYNSLDDMLNDSEHYLRKAKKNGRNRIESNLEI